MYDDNLFWNDETSFQPEDTSILEETTLNKSETKTEEETVREEEETKEIDETENKTQDYPIFDMDMNDAIYTRKQNVEDIAGVRMIGQTDWIIRTNSTLLLKQGGQIRTFQFPNTLISNTFVDITGTHIMATMRNKVSNNRISYSVEYLNNAPDLKHIKVATMARLNELLEDREEMTAVGWIREVDSNGVSSDSFLMGTSESNIYFVTLNIQMKPGRDPTIRDQSFKVANLKRIFGKGNEVTMPGIKQIEVFQATGDEKTSKYIVMVATESNLFQFYGKGGGEEWKTYFDVYESQKIKPTVHDHWKGQMNVEPTLQIRQKEDKEAPLYRDSMMWVGVEGILHGPLSYEDTIDMEQDKKNFFEDSEFIKYGKDMELDITAIATTDYHLLVAVDTEVHVYACPPDLIMKPIISDDMGETIHQQRIQHIDVSLGRGGGGSYAAATPTHSSKPKTADTKKTFDLSELKLVEKYYFDSQVIGFAKEPSLDNNILWVYTKDRILRVTPMEEGRDIWRYYLSKALHPLYSHEDYFKTAYELVNLNREDKDIVLQSKANFLFQKGHYAEAAREFADTTIDFEDVVIMFYEANQRKPLMKYLLKRLGDLKQLCEKEKNATATIPLRCLCSYIAELYLDAMNNVDDTLITGESNKELSSLRENYYAFLSEYGKFLNDENVLQLIETHGATEDMLHFSSTINEYGKVISHHVMLQQYDKAVDVLEKNTNSQSMKDLFYRYAPILMEKEPIKMIECLQKALLLDHGQLIPALMRYLNSDPQNGSAIVMKYLQWTIDYLGTEEPAIHNLLVSLYAKEEDEERLCQFLNNKGGHVFFDIKYALRVCMENHQIKASAFLYAEQGMYYEAVNLALKKNDEDLAKKYANKPTDPELRKRLWLLIIKHVIVHSNTDDVSKAITFLQETGNTLSLEDILVYFPDSVKIKSFYEKIKTSLAEYKSNITDLKNSMSATADSANLIRDELQSIKHRSQTIYPHDSCHHCGQPVLSKEFVVFPCHHIFHMPCLLTYMSKHADDATRARLAALKDAKKKGGDIDKRHADFEELMMKECPLCGDLMVQTIDMSFIDEDDEGGWSILN
mmetsp:Transcript_11492/g.17010  ORF Transcript_11492/g.17010 Transcript_11492/m.17010 type:complete len:1082 (-) Transcript_11492:1766-5011(-)